MNVYGAKNLIPYPYHRQSGYTTNGATFTYDEDGVITVNKVTGNATAFFGLFSNVLYPDAKKFLAPNTSYILSMELENATNTSLYVSVHDSDVAAIRNKATGKYETLFTTPETIDSLIVGLYYAAQVTENNAKVKLMIRLASIQDSTYEPYSMTNKELTDKLNIVQDDIDELNAEIADKLDKYESVAVSVSGKTFAQQLSELYTTWQTLPVERKMRAFLKINMSIYNIVNIDTGLFSTCSLDASHHYITQFDFGTGHFYISTDNSVSDSSNAINNYSMELYA